EECCIDFSGDHGAEAFGIRTSREERYIFVGFQVEMLKKDKLRVVCVGSESADAQLFSLQLFQPADIGADKNEKILPSPYSRYEHEVVARHVGLNNRTPLTSGRC